MCTPVQLWALEAPPCGNGKDSSHITKNSLIPRPKFCVHPAVSLTNRAWTCLLGKLGPNYIGALLLKRLSRSVIQHGTVEKMRVAVI